MFNFLKINTASDRATPFGLDLSDLSVKIVQIVGGRGVDAVRGFSCVPIAAGSVMDGEVVSSDSVVASIQKALSSSWPKKIRSRQVFCSLPETKAFLRVIDVPKMESKKLGEAIKWEMEENIPLPIDDVYYDWQVLGRSFGVEKKNESVLVVAVARTIVDGFISVVESAGLEVVGMEVESIAQARSLIPDSPGASEETTLIIDIGDRRTSLLFSVGDAICFTSSTHLSSQMFTDAIARQFGISSEKAEKMKMEKGIGSFVHRDAIFVCVEPILENLVAHINDTIHFFLTSLRYSSVVHTVVLCGGGAYTKGFSPFLSRRLGRDVRRGDPWQNVRRGRGIPPIPKDSALQYSTAIGLALQSVRAAAQQDVFERV